MGRARLLNGRMDLAKKLTRLFEARNLSYQDVAKHCGTNKTTVNNWVNHGLSPKLSQARALATLLGVPLDHLADDAQDEPAPGPSERRIDIEKVIARIGEDEAYNRLIVVRRGKRERQPMVRDPLPGAAGPAPGSPGTEGPARPPAATPQSPPRRADGRNSG
jgi:transcriptional regulator with XRE-family HTH domain